jgi:hypothetical protein
MSPAKIPALERNETAFLARAIMIKSCIPARTRQFNCPVIEAPERSTMRARRKLGDKARSRCRSLDRRISTDYGFRCQLTSVSGDQNVQLALRGAARTRKVACAGIPELDVLDCSDVERFSRRNASKLGIMIL